MENHLFGAVGLPTHHYASVLDVIGELVWKEPGFSSVMDLDLNSRLPIALLSTMEFSNMMRADWCTEMKT